MTAAAFRALAREAAGRYPRGERFARHFAFGKLTADPAFRALVAEGLLAGKPSINLLDIGCGQGVLEALLLAARDRQARGEWPPQWPALPALQRLRGIDLDASQVARARAACGAPAIFIQADMRHADFGDADVVVMLDVLHYVEAAVQDAILERVRAALSPGGVLLLRVADAGRGWRFALTDWTDRMAMRARGHRFDRLHSRPAAAWRERLAGLGFRVGEQPMSAGTPFANVLLVARYDAG